ncbi:MAG TPA: hypothetical protein DCS19_11020 [Flavobacterium sp.]|nr:hypothetical protein [Flavobacterium sp.]
MLTCFNNYDFKFYNMLIKSNLQQKEMKKFKQFSITVYDQFVLFETRSFFSNLLHNNDCEGYHFWSQTYQ